MTIRLGILGIGSMGRHHVRNARATGGVELANSDPSERIAELSRKLLNV